ncbi:hypothetical protein PF005_g13768 [Phytophthora fragariae]|uniref:Uncharacterized protein n=1 Tax=Phytophthora fragariae TaxID=53985 RepID=A0A6A3U457_9STRA|nr:hypothetical protein PF009_g15082 [Phytophthora fragariae]KAE9003744.1 hypothetical protein PF011_g12769 [Phytophthora fragariae]KAE9104099.1 hypothetical protein PF010_g13500 [Phytophthora fragariae]KAE9104284.1 hypothetical protein PF007_g14105 [Phytophthora fragariae]KAE9141851.1 hypothetical protein PF006_g12992 [Phytophthora fragariae]
MESGDGDGDAKDSREPSTATVGGGASPSAMEPALEDKSWI